LDQVSREFHANTAYRSNNRVVLLSAASGEGVDQLSFSLGQVLGIDWKTVEINIPWSDGKTLAWIYERGEIIDRRNSAESVQLTVRLHPRDVANLESKLPN
jgi:GTP-binding protein HflX